MQARTRARRVITVAVMGLGVVALSATSAFAHVTIAPDSAPRGGFQILSFSVPNEKDNASTVQVQVQLPQDQVIPFVSVQPKPGWTVSVTKRQLTKPVKQEGETITEAVDTVTWSGGTIGPGQFDLFTISAGPLPTKVKQLTFKALQTYSDGEVVRWIEPTPKGGPEPEHPAPVLTLTKGKAGH